MLKEETMDIIHAQSSEKDTTLPAPAPFGRACSLTLGVLKKPEDNHFQKASLTKAKDQGEDHFFLVLPFDLPLRLLLSEFIRINLAMKYKKCSLQCDSPNITKQSLEM